MEVLIIPAFVYLALCMLASPELFAVQATFLIVSFSTLGIYFLSGYEYVLYIYVLIVLTFGLRKLKPSLIETLVFVLLFVGTAFWLSMQEFIDGYVYSYTIVATSLAIFSKLAFSSSNGRILSLLCFCLGNAFANATISLTDSQAFCTAFLILYILTQNYSLKINAENSKNDERYRLWRYLSPIRS